MLVEVMVPVRSVTKGLVLALTTPAQVEMLARRPRTPLHVLEVRASHNRVRTGRRAVESDVADFTGTRTRPNIELEIQT